MADPQTTGARPRLAIVSNLPPLSRKERSAIWLGALWKATLRGLVLTPIFIGTIWCVAKIATFPEFLAMWGILVANGYLVWRQHA